MLEAFGQIDILINNAGITQPVKFMDITPENWDRIIDVNLSGVLYLSQAFIPHMRERKQGSIACMSSVSAQRGGGIFGGPHYSAAKAGVLGLAKAMARELGPDGIRVNCVTPGLIQTDITGGKLTDEMRAEIIKGIPLEPARRRRGRGGHLPVPGLRPLRLRHRRGDRRQRRHADPLTGRPPQNQDNGGTCDGSAADARQRAEPGRARLPHPPQRAAHGRGAGPGLYRPGARHRRRAGRRLFPCA